MPATPSPATFDIFKLNAPGDSFMKFLYMPNTTPNPTEMTIHAININTTACFNVNVFDILSSIQNVTFTINGVNYTATIEASIYYAVGNYYYFKVTPITVPFSQDINSCSLTTFEPSIVDPAFFTGDYNATFGNAVNDRTSAFIFDVDRVRNQAIPTNYNSIIDESAEKAPVQDSNYSSIGHKRSKYDGSKTNITEYGFEGAINPSLFEGAIYNNDKISGEICSQSLDQKPIKDYLFTDNLEPGESRADLYPSETIVDLVPGVNPDLKVPTVLYSFHGNWANWNSSTSTFDYTVGDSYIRFPRSGLTQSQGANNTIEAIYDRFVNADKNTVYIIKISNVGEQWVSFSDFTPNYDSNGDIDYIEATIKQANAIPISIYNNTYPIQGGDFVSIYKVKGDTIYNTEGSQIFKVTDKLIYVADTEKIYYINEHGQLIYQTLNCLT